MNFQHQRQRWLAMGWLGAGLLFPCQLGVKVSASPGSREPLSVATVQSEMRRLVGEDAEKAYFSSLFKPVTPNEGESDDVVSLEPFVVLSEKIPDFTPPRETSVEKYIRTGTITQHVGRKVTTRIWMKGDRGIMLSFSF